MLYLHSRPTPIVHRDLKPQNLLVTQGWTVKVGDFGLSTVKNTTMLAAPTANVMGTLAWAAPELLKGQAYDERVDTYSFGVVLYQMVTDRQPYQGMYEDERILLVQRVCGMAPSLMDQGIEVDPPPGAAGDAAGSDRVRVDERVDALLRRCLADDAKERPRFGEILETLQRLQAEQVGLGPRRAQAERPS